MDMQEVEKFLNNIVYVFFPSNVRGDSSLGYEMGGGWIVEMKIDEGNKNLKRGHIKKRWGDHISQSPTVANTIDCSSLKEKGI